MRNSTRGIATFGACLVALSTVACNKGPAQEALRAAEQALAAAPEILTYQPEEFAAVSGILGEARAAFAAGRYTDALRAALVLPDRVAAAAASAAKRKEQSAATWSALSADLPPRLEALAARLTALASASPTSSERLMAAQSEFATLRQGWADATAEYERGDVPKAVAVARDLKLKADLLAERLGLKLDPARRGAHASSSLRVALALG